VEAPPHFAFVVLDSAHGTTTSSNILKPNPISP
jgi:hypothetical protein